MNHIAILGVVGQQVLGHFAKGAGKQARSIWSTTLWTSLLSDETPALLYRFCERLLGIENILLDCPFIRKHLLSSKKNV